MALHLIGKDCLTVHPISLEEEIYSQRRRKGTVAQTKSSCIVIGPLRIFDADQYV